MTVDHHHNESENIYVHLLFVSYFMIDPCTLFYLCFYFSLDPLRGYQGEDIEIQLPGNLTVYDIDWLAVWCVQYRHNFGHVIIPKDLDVPPALGQTKITVSHKPNTSSSNKRKPTKKRPRFFFHEDRHNHPYQFQQQKPYSMFSIARYF